jgi:glycine cleavage system regulatory protein
MKYIYILTFVLALNSCSAKKEEGSHQSLSSTTDQCDPKEAKSQLTKLFDNYYRYPPFIIAVAARTIRECLGIVAFEIELDDYYKTSKEKYALVHPKRSFASADSSKIAEYEREFKTWSETYKAIDLTSKTVKYTGIGSTIFVIVAATIAAPQVVIPAAAWTALSGVAFHTGLDTLNIGVEKASTAVLDKIINDPRIDYKKLEKTLSEHKDDPDKGEQAYNEELLRQTNPYPDLADIPSVDDKFRVTRKQIETAYRYSGHQALSLENTKKNIAEMKIDIEKMRGHRDQLLNGQIQFMSHMTNGLSALTNSFDNLSTQVQYLLKVLYKDMTTAEKLYAIEKLNFGEFKNPEEREKAISELQTKVKDEENKDRISTSFEEKKSNFEKGSKAIQDTMEIFNNLGLSSPDLNAAANAVINAWRSYVQFQAQDYLGALASFTRVFGKDQSDLKHEQIVNYMKELHRLLAMSIKLQLQTMSLIAQLSDQTEAASRNIQNTLEVIVNLQGYDFLSNYIEKLRFISQCESFQKGIKVNIVTFGKSDQELEKEGLLTNLPHPEPNSKSSLPSGKNPTTIDSVVLAMKSLPIASFQTFHSILSQSIDVSRDLRDCLPRLNEVANELAAFAQGNGNLDGNFTSLGQTISDTSNLLLRDQLVKSKSVRKSTMGLLHQLFLDSELKYKSAPNQILFAGLNPSFAITDLIKRVSWLRKNYDEAKKYIDKKQIGHLLKKALLNEEIIDPQFLISFLRSYLQIYALSRFINPNSSSDRFVANLEGLIVSTWNPEIEATLLSLAKLVDLTIFQQTLLGGDVLYEIYDAHFDPAYKSELEGHVDGSLIDDAISILSQDKKTTIKRILTNSPTLLRGLVKYRLVKALKGESRFSYMLKYELATDSKYLSLLSDLYEKIGMRISEPTTDGTLHASFVNLSIKNDVPVPAKGTEKEDEMHKQVSDGINNRTQANIDVDEISRFENKIKVLTPEEMYDDRLAPTEYTVELLKLREALLLEAYHYKSQTTNPQSKIDLIYKSLKAVVTM